MGGRFLVAGVHPYPEFPLAIYSRGTWAARTNGQWFLPAVTQLRARGVYDSSAERHAREFMLRDLGTKPDLVLIDTNSRGHTTGPADFDFLKFYEEDPSFRIAWSSYGEIDRIGQFRQFVRLSRSHERQPSLSQSTP
jgi:hypothetical protein